MTPSQNSSALSGPGAGAGAGAGHSSILEGNSYRASARHPLSERKRSLIDRRAQRLGSAYRLFYQEPVEIVRGSGARVWDADGVEYLDLYNNVPSLGHAHPAVVDAVTRQMSLLNTHTRYLHESILDFADDLVSTMPEELSQVMLVCTGSEANDLALRVGREFTGNRAWIATREAYHGNTALVSSHSPSLASVELLDPTLRVVSPPDTYRAGSSDAAGARFLGEIRNAIAEIEASGDGLAGLIADFSFSSDGVFTGDRGMVREAVELVQAHGGIVIADEVQPGFARTGEEFWGFSRHGIVPDIVTTGKPMGNGFPVAAMIARADVLDAFAGRRPYFNTFGGNPVSVAAAHAVMKTIRAEGLQEHALHVGADFRSALRSLASIHRSVGDVRGVGLYTAVELVADSTNRQPDTALALDVIEGLRRRGVLTSVCGPDNNVLKLRPPLAFEQRDITVAVEALDGALTEAAAHSANTTSMA